jgi:hypothetical protein
MILPYIYYGHYCLLAYSTSHARGHKGRLLAVDMRGGNCLVTLGSSTAIRISKTRPMMVRRMRLARLAWQWSYHDYLGVRACTWTVPCTGDTAVNRNVTVKSRYCMWSHSELVLPGTKTLHVYARTGGLDRTYVMKHGNTN